MLAHTSQTNRSTRPPLNPSDIPKSAWEYYIEETEKEDSGREREWQELLDVVLVFSAIFASVLSTFLVKTLDLLEENPLDAIQDILLYQTLIMQNRTIQPYVAPVFSPRSYAIIVNALFFTSLGVVLLTAVLCMLVKGWIRALDRKLWAIPDLQKRAVIKELRQQGMTRWRLPGLIAILPSLIHLSLVFFFIGLVVYLFHVHKLPAFLSFAIFGIGVLVYVVPILISVIDEFSPFRSVYSGMLRGPYRRMYSRLTDSLRSHSTMALPQSTIEKIRERVIMFVQEHIPLSEKAILEPSSSSNVVISRTTVPILNKIFTYTAEWDAWAYPKNISTCILLQLHDPRIRSPSLWPFLSHCDTSSLSIEKVQCLAYGICMQDHNVYNVNWDAVIEVLDRSSDPWFHLVASLLWVRRIDGLGRILEREADILQAISNTDQLTTDQWCFALSSVCALFPRTRGAASPQVIRAFTRVLARLLQKRVYYIDRSTVEGNGAIDFWLYVMTSILDNPISLSPSNTTFLHAEDIEAPGKGMARDPSCIRRLAKLSRARELDPSFMGGCLVSILFILLRLQPMDQQEKRLINQYLEIIGEEMDVAAWSFALSEFFINQHSWPYGMSGMVLCLLRGEYTDLEDNYYSRAIMSEYDLKLRAADAEPTTSILQVLNCVISLPSIIGLQLQDTWLSLYANNRTRSPHTSALPTVWSSDCASIASDRLDLYDRGRVSPELGLVTFFLSCPVASIACRALRRYLHLQEDAHICSSTQHLNSLSIIFRRGLSVQENCEGWLLLVDIIIPNWDNMPLEGRARFVETFFGYGNQAMMDQYATPAGAGEGDEEKVLGRASMGTPMRTTQTGGLGWMEDVWRTILRALVREVHIERAESYWSELSRVMPETYPRLPEPEKRILSLDPRISSEGWDEASEWTSDAEGMSDAERTSDDGEANSTLKPDEKRLEDSGRGLLGVLALLLEAGGNSMPEALLNDLRQSPLLSDERLRHDTESLSRIKAILDHN